MRTVVFILGTGILLLASAIGALWMGVSLVAVEVIVFTWSLVWLLLLRTRAARRYEHAISLVAAVVLALLYAIGAWALNDDYVRWASQWNGLVAGNVSLVGFGLPPTAERAIPLINALMLFVWTWVKAVLLAYPRRSTASNVTLVGLLYGWAYERVNGELKLKPWWIFGRWAGSTLAILGASILIREWWSLRSVPLALWFPLIPCSLIMVGVEWHLWLSGLVSVSAEPEFGEGVETATPQGMLDDLWCRYRARWPAAWRAAGNRPPEAERGG